jgi:hypothetical protein
MAHRCPLVKGYACPSLIPLYAFEKTRKEHATMPRNPTEKQKKFAQAVADGENYSQAYRKAYSAEGSSPETVRVNAHRVANNANVSPMIDDLRARNDRGLQRNLGSRRRWILDRLLEEAESLESTPASRVKSLELLAKLAGMFDSEKERAEKREHATESELIAELNQRLTQIVEKPLEVSAVSIGDVEESGDEEEEGGTPV